jgi:hypothetical protein
MVKRGTDEMCHGSQGLSKKDAEAANYEMTEYRYDTMRHTFLFKNTLELPCQGFQKKSPGFRRGLSSQYEYKDQ